MRTRVHYHLSDYISHRVAGLAFMRALAGAGVLLVEDPEDADVLVIHDDPFFYQSWVKRYKGDKTVIAYCVWETETLPEPFRRDLDGVDRVWTCTPWSARAFERAGLEGVDLVPHVVELARPEPADMEAVREIIDHRDGLFYFYTIVDTVNPRKNLETLLRVFARAFHADERARLVVKQYRHSWDLGGLRNIISLTDTLTPERMAALHHVCHACVSAHHAEAWGLALSDAMSVGNPVIATGYSGNMFYMDRDNSLPVRYRLGPVSGRMCELVPLFTPEMQWAEVDEEHMAYCMLRVANHGVDPELRANARSAMQRFGPEVVGARMKRILDSPGPGARARGRVERRSDFRGAKT